MEELLKKFHENGLIPPKGLSFKKLQDRLQIELKKKNPIHDKLSKLSLDELRSLYKQTIGEIPIHIHSMAKRLKKDLAAFYFDQCPTMEPSTFLKNGVAVEPTGGHQLEFSVESSVTEMCQGTISSTSHQIDFIKDPQVLEESLEDFVATIPLANLDNYFNVLSHEMMKEDMTDEEKRLAILQLSKDCFGVEAVKFLKECQVASVSGENVDNDCQMTEIEEVSLLHISFSVSFKLYSSFIF